MTPTPQPPKCSTCPKENTKKCKIDFRGLNGNSDILSGILRVTNNCRMGCHPDARAYLMRDVIKEIIPTHKRQTRTLDDGWKVEVKWLIEIKKHLSPEYESMDLEDIEGVLFALVKSLRGEP